MHTSHNIIKCLATTALLSQIFTYSNVSYAEEKHSYTKIKQEMQSEKNSQISNDSSQGLLGYYFRDQNFQHLSLMAHRQASGLELPKNEVENLLSEDQQHIQSVRWIGYIKPDKTENYILSTSSDQQVMIDLDGKNILKQAPMVESVQLEKDKLYKIRIEYIPEKSETKDMLLNFKLNWSISGEKPTEIPDNVFVLPDLSRKQDPEKIIPEESLFQKQGDKKKASRSKRSLTTTPLYDTDDDGIYDDWETSGYTIQRQLAVKWDDSMKARGYKKYISNPYNSHTIGDPYTDWEKAAGRIDKAVKAEARNPLVAAYPAVGVNMEKVIISEKQNISTGLGKTVSASTSASNTAGITAGIDATVGASLLGPSGSVTTHFSYTGSSTSTVENSSSNNWSQDLGIDTGQSAYLNANVRYYNTGTAPIYNVKPTTNFVLEDNTIVTVKAKENQLGDVLKAGGVYPEKNLAPIALNTLDDFGSQLIPINYDQTKRLETGSKLHLQTTQASGLYGTIKANGGLEVNPSQEWEPVRAQIESLSAGIVLDTGEETLERRVAAKDDRDPEDLTPQLTIEEAIKIAFDTVEKNGKLYYKDTILNESLVEIIFDESTVQEVKAQLDMMPDQDKKIYNIKLKRGMNIMIKKPVWYSDFDTNKHGWKNVTLMPDLGVTGRAGKINNSALLNYPTNKKLKPHTQYKFKASVRYPDLSAEEATDKSQTVITKVGNDAKKHIIHSNRYQQIAHTFTSSSNPDDNLNFTISNFRNDGVLVDDISIVELRPSTEIEKFGKVLAHMDSNGEYMGFEFQYGLPETETLEFFMNGEKKVDWTVDVPEAGIKKDDFPTFQLNISPVEAKNPNNRFEIKYKGNTLVNFKGQS
ncbi:hypothetical protein BK702_09900 [Bacillus thuringiensis serovar cameroun]|uniref:Vip1Ba2-like protein n=1 Tax=Bacillus thuringiensis TaxID=1428 RepID=A0A6F7TSY0_BACTU|nr:Vip1Ba2-like protein [Bacillus thuringiensis]OTW90202.1 hypothetical protein BK702_09900 [Bacillus thuringiensis serovar cameroun]